MKIIQLHVETLVHRPVFRIVKISSFLFTLSNFINILESNSFFTTSNGFSIRMFMYLDSSADSYIGSSDPKFLVIFRLFASSWKFFHTKNDFTASNNEFILFIVAFNF